MVKEYSIAEHFQLNARIGWQGLTTSEYLNHGSYLLISGTDFKDGFIDWDSVVFVSKERFDQDKKIQLQEGDILVTKDGTIGKVARVENLNFPATLNSGVFVVRPKTEEINATYFYYHLLSNHFSDFLAKLTAGSTITHLYQKDFIHYKFNLPSKPEQIAVATALSDMDGLIAATKKLIAKKEAIKLGLMQELLSGKKRLPRYNREWVKEHLGRIISVYRGGSPRPISSFITEESNGVNWIKIGDTDKNGKYITSCKEKIKPEGEANSRRVYKGDLLLSNSMSFGRPYLLKIGGCIHDGWLALQNYKEVFDTEYLFYLLSSQIVYDQYLKKAAGSGVLNLNKKLVESIELKFPSNLNEQKAIAEILASCDKEIEQLNQKLNKLVQLKQGMMQNLLTGRIRLANPEKKYEWEEGVLPMAAEPSNEEFFASPTLDKEKEAAILAMLVGKNNLRLGRFRYQKLMYLFHRKTDNAISGWLNKAAGPYNHDLRYRGVEDMVVTKGWCTNTSQDPEHPRFEKGSNYQEAKQQFLKHYTITPMNWMKRHFLFEKDNELELSATVDKARLARARNKLSANWRGIKEYIAQEPEWEDKLKKPHFSDENLKRAVGILGRLFEYE